LSFAGNPEDIRQWDVRAVGRLLLRTSLEFDRLIVGGTNGEGAVAALRASKLALPKSVIEALRSVAPLSRGRVVKQLRVKDLSTGMVLDEDLVSLKGIRLVPAGQEVTQSLIVRLTSIGAGVGVAEPFRVSVSS
jgi:hypothetical protein